MNEQSYKNHRQIVYRYYLFTGVPIIILIALSVIKWVGGMEINSNLLFLLIGYILLTMLFRSRSFALRAQDRAIRAEEGLRYFILTGKRMDPRLSIGQIIALRFASDEEFPGLAQRAAIENLSNNAIKREIKNWRSDLYRV
jgi:hypothetical protein